MITPPPRVTSLPTLLGAAAVALASLLAYLPALSAGYVWDDDRYLTANALVQASRGLGRIWFSAETMDYYPVTYTSFWLEWRLWGSNPAGYHATNVLLHAACALLLWRLLHRIGVPGAWMAGLLFAIHPLNVESVAWISQRKNTLAMLFYLLSALSLLRWHREPGPASLGLATGLFAASLLSKPIAVMFPVVILLYAWWRRPADVRRLVAASLPFFALAALCGVMTVAFQQAHSIQGEAVGPAGMRGRLLVAARALTFYVQKALWPSGLCAVYPRWTPDGLWKPGLLSAALLLSAAAALFVRRDSGAERAGLFALGYYALMLFPVLGFLDVGFMFYASAADHWAYAALPALFAAAGAAADGVRRSIRPPPLRLAATAGASVLAAALAAASYRQAGVYRGMGTLFSHTVARNPRAWVAHAWLGNLALDDGRLDAAEEHYLLALRCRPDYWEAQNGLGIVFARRGNLDVAAELFRAVLDRKPEHASARRNLRLAMAQKSAGALRGRGLPLPGAAARADPGPQQAQ